MYKYETHLHTYPVSKCAKVGVRENLLAYKALDFDGVFITNHFIDGNINSDGTLTYPQLLDFYFSDYEQALKIGEEIGIKVFLGLEISYKGTDFLIYGLDKEWYYDHPEIMDMKKTEELAYLAEAGALIIHAHPYREARYIDHIRLFPRSVHGVEVINSCRTEFENKMAGVYAREYGLLKFAGTDNHIGGARENFAGMQSRTPIKSEADFVKRVLAGKMKVFTLTKE